MAGRSGRAIFLVVVLVISACAGATDSTAEAPSNTETSTSQPTTVSSPPSTTSAPTTTAAPTTTTTTPPPPAICAAAHLDSAAAWTAHEFGVAVACAFAEGDIGYASAADPTGELAAGLADSQLSLDDSSTIECDWLGSVGAACLVRTGGSLVAIISGTAPAPDAPPTYRSFTGDAAEVLASLPAQARLSCRPFAIAYVDLIAPDFPAEARVELRVEPAIRAIELLGYESMTHGQIFFDGTVEELALSSETWGVPVYFDSADNLRTFDDAFQTLFGVAPAATVEQAQPRCSE